MIIYPHGDRKKSREMIKRLDSFSSRIELMALGKIPFNQSFAAGVTALTDTPDMEKQHRVLLGMADSRRKQHIDQLVELARDDLTAFAEVVSPNEPPAPHHILICDYLMEVESGLRSRLMLTMPPGHAKDLDVETPVLMGDGSWKRLGSIEVGDIVITMHGRPREVLAVHDQGVRPVLKIITASGRHIRPHPDHQFLTPHGWMPAKDLEVGNCLAIPQDYEIPGDKRRSHDDFAFAGFMMARAVVTGRAYSRLHRINDKFRCDDAAILAEMKTLSARLGFSILKYTEQTLYKRYSATMQFDWACKNWLRRAGLLNVAKREARIPPWIFLGDDSRIAAFLGALFSCDSTWRPITKVQDGSSRIVSMAIRRNAAIAEDIQKLLQRMGIKARLQRSHMIYNYEPTAFYRVQIVSARDQALFAKRIPIIGNTRRFWQLPIPTQTFGSEQYHNDEIRHIVADGECETRCITVEEDSSFLANGIVVHNSTYASRYYPAWYLGRRENRLYLQGGHSGPFAEKEFGRKTKDLVSSDAYHRIFPDIGVRFDAKAAGDWMLNNGNRYIAKGVGDGISGFRSTNNGIDDPYPNYAAAQSPVKRKAVWEWFVNDFMTRLLPQGNALVITCMTGDTNVSMADGTYKRLDEVRPGDFVLAWKDGNLVSRQVLNFAPQGEDEIFEIRTGNSRVMANARHPFKVRRKNGTQEWVRVRDLKHGDFLVTSANTPGNSDATLTEKEAWLLGFMFGDGWITRRDTTQVKKSTGTRVARRGYVTCAAIKANVRTNAEVAETFNAIFGVTPKPTKFGYIRTDIANIGRWFTERGLIGKAKTKRLPSYLFDAPLSVRLAFLEGYGAADGSVAHTGKDGAVPRMVFVSCNEELITDVRHLARGCGFNVTNISVSHPIGNAPNSPKPTESKRVTFAYSPGSRTDDSFRANSVRSITPVGREMVYDIQVDDAECFIADGLVTHNTRWHLDDIVGRLNEMMDTGEIEERWDFINLPVFCVDPDEDQMHRALGEPLWPDFYTEATLLRQKALMSSGQWASLYEGNPVPAEGNVIKAKWLLSRYRTPPLIRANTITGSRIAQEIAGDAGDPAENKNEKIDATGENVDPTVPAAPRIIESAPPYVRTVLSCDSAEKDTARADYSAITIWRETIDRRHYLVDAHRERMEFPRLVACIDEYAALWQCEVVLMEAKGAGNQYCQHVLADEKQRDFVVVPIEPGKDGKIFRMDAVTPFFMANRVILPERAAWLSIYERELLQFPGSKNDDYADTTSQYLKWVRDTSMVRRGTKKMRA